MNRKELLIQRKRVRTLAKAWLGPLGLLWWHIDIKFYDSEPEFRAATGHDAYMTVCGDWRYDHATINVNLPAIERLDDDRLEFNFVHECAHVILSEMKAGKGDEHCEHVATIMAKAFRWVRDAAERQGREQKT